MSRYRSELVERLAEQQSRFAPQAVRRRQIASAEDFLVQVRSDCDYAWGHVCRCVTGYQTDESVDVELNGAELAHDLRCFIEDLSDSLDFSLKDLGEPALTVREISARYCVSSKTVDRWRDRGLASRRVSVDGRKRVVVPESTLQRFVATHQEEIDRGRNFNQMTDTERERLVSDARSLAGQGLGLTEVSRELGRRYGRATETVRYTLRDFDQANPEKAVFSCPEVEMSQENLALLYDLFCQGVSVPDLSRRFGRSKPAIHSALADFRVQRVRSMTIDFMYNEEFDSEAAEVVICGEPPEYDREKTSVRVPSNLPAYLAELYKVPLLNREQEQYYFRKMNFLKYRAATLQRNLGGRRGDMVAVKQIEELLDTANDVKNLLTRSNLRLVVSIAKRHLKPGVNFFELVSDGNMSLIRAIEKFDYSRGNKFSTYASWAIMKNFARSVPAEHTRLDRFRTGCDDVFFESQDPGTNAFVEERVNMAQRKAISEILKELDGRERRVISCRFGLTRGSEPETLEEVGNRLGVTKERVRQIEVRTLEKLRRIARRKQVDIPGI